MLGWEELELEVVRDANGKMITFKVTAHDADGLIGEGIHTRAVIDNARFLQKCNDKLARV